MRAEQHRAPKEKGSKPRRSGFAIMKGLIGLVRHLAPVMGLAIVLGVIGYLCAIFLTVIAGYGILGKLQHTGMELPSRIVVLLCVVAVARGILHYGEQYCNHFIAFRLLAIIRHRVFAQLRKLCPAKLEGKDRGDLIAIITSDIELLEVFYAHTISPIAIAILTSIVMVIYIGHFTLAGALCAVCAYLVVGALIPILMGKRGAAAGVAYREKVSEMNSYMLESLYGIDETIRYGNGSERLEGIDRYSADQIGRASCRERV